MIKNSWIKKIICLSLTLGIFINTISYASMWRGYVPSNQWAVSVGLTSNKSESQLTSVVSLSDFYTTIVKYLKLNGVSPRNETIYHNDDADDLDNVAKGIFNIINSYNSRNSLTIQQYYIVESYVDHAKKTLEDYMEYSYKLTRESLKNIQLYLDLSKYKAATLIDKKSDRDYILSKIGNIKNYEILDYNILPYAGSVTRREFFVVVYDLMSANEISENAIIDELIDSGMIEGYVKDGNQYELDKKITYAEMYRFLYKLQNFDFNPGSADDANE